MYLKGEAIELGMFSKSELQALIGSKVQYLCNRDIDKTGRGYFFPRLGTITEIHGRQISFDGQWESISSIVEMVKR